MDAKPSEIYSAEVSLTCDSASTRTLKGDPIKAGKVVEIRTFLVVDLTTANKTLRIGFERAGSQYWLKRKGAGAAEYGIALEEELILVEGERPIAQVETPTQNDALVMLARGVYL